MAFFKECVICCSDLMLEGVFHLHLHQQDTLTHIQHFLELSEGAVDFLLN